MNPSQFAAKWERIELRERAASQEHFIDLCRMVGVETPVEADPKGEFFTFDKSLRKESGSAGFADVWRKDCFAWEYKGLHEDLAEAYKQLQLYREALGNPPLLVVCDLDRFEIHTNFNNTVKRVFTFQNADIPSDDPVPGTQLTPIQVLRALFENPQTLHPGKSQSRLTQEAAELLRLLADDLRKWNATSKEPVTDQEIAHFIMRMIFCFFASDVGLLAKEAFTDLITINKSKPEAFRTYLGDLFNAMKDGGIFLMREVPHFDGGLFDDASVPNLITDQIAIFERLNSLDWSDIDPSIFGTLFERIIDQSKRKQLGAHYTSREDIELIVEPVLMQPLRADWDRTKAKAQSYVDSKDELKKVLTVFQDRLATIKILDPACGSGNFLYVSLALLKALEKEVIAFAAMYGLEGFTPKVHPQQLFGIESNEYASELAGVVVWIGYLQWKHRNAFDLASEDPILQPLNNIHLNDAIVDFSDLEHPTEPKWPPADVIVGNPPFLGSKKLRRELGDEYVDAMFEVWGDRVPREADLCCYWFEKARKEIELGRAKRAGLLATQAIRGGKNRTVLSRIADGGSIFWAQSDRPWVLEGAAVHVSMVGFDNGAEKTRELDGLAVTGIYTNLRSGETDVTTARRLKENLGIAFMGDTKGGPFDVSVSIANRLLAQPNPDGRSNADVLRPWINGLDITGRGRDVWVIDFGTDMRVEEAALYEAPFEYVREHVKPQRDNSRTTINEWWLHERPRVEMRQALGLFDRYIGTPLVAKHRFFVWLAAKSLPANVVIIIAKDDDYHFGVLHSRVHEVWARATGTQLREVESGFRYTPTTTFETFPFPTPATEQQDAIAEAARHLDDLREGWLNPPELSVGPSELKKRTLTNLYNDPPTWLDLVHKRLDEAVFQAYAWEPTIPDGLVLARLLALNLERAAVDGD